MAKSTVAQTSLKPFTSLGRDELPYYRIMAGELEEALGTLRELSGTRAGAHLLQVISQLEHNAEPVIVTQEQLRREYEAEVAQKLQGGAS
jgi:hypothetical protein